MNFIIRPSKPHPDFVINDRSLVLCSNDIAEFVPRDLAIYYSEKIAELLAEKPLENVIIIEENIRINYLLEFLHLRELTCTPAELNSFITSLDSLRIRYSLEVKYDGGPLRAG